MRQFIVAAVLALCLVDALACGGAGEGSPTPESDAYRYSRGIYTVRPDGRDLTLLHERDAGFFPARSYSLSADGRWLAFTSGETLYLSAMGSDESPTPLADFEVVWGLALSPDAEQIVVYGRFNGEEGVYLVTTQDGVAVPFSIESAHFPSWSPAGDRLVFASGAGSNSIIYTASSDGSEPTEIARGRANFAWSADGSLLALAVYCCGGEGIHLASADGNVTKVSDTRPAVSSTIAWAPDDRRIAFATGIGDERLYQIKILDVESGEETLLARGSDPTWSPDGSRIAFIRDGNLYVIDVDGTGETKITNPTQPFVASPHWLPDGSRLLFSFAPPFEESVYVISADGGADLKLADGYAPVWSPDGERIAFVGGSTGLSLSGESDIYVMNRDGTGVRKLARYGWSDLIPQCFWWSTWSWSPDGELIAYDDMAAEHIYLATVEGEAEPRSLTGGFGPTWSPDGSRIAFSTWRPGWEEAKAGCTIQLTNVEGERETEELTAGESASWSPDGRRIAFLRDGDLFVINADGTGERKLADTAKDWGLLEDPGYRAEPRWSPDGSRLLASPAGDIVLIDVDDGQARPVASGHDPVWSHDGTRIAFVVEGSDWTMSIYVADVEGGEPRFLTEGRDPAWSPGGDQIAFTR